MLNGTHDELISNELKRKAANASIEKPNITREEINERLLSLKIRATDNHYELCDTIDNLCLKGQAAQDYYSGHYKANFDMEAISELKYLTAQLQNLKHQNPR